MEGVLKEMGSSGARYKSKGMRAKNVILLIVITSTKLCLEVNMMITFLSRDNMIELGFKNWIACEAENRDDVSSEHGTSVSVGRGGVGGKNITGMDPHDVHQWVMDMS